MKEEPKPIKAQLTLRKVCEIMSDVSGESITPETHYIKACVELTRDAPNYSLTTFKAFKR